LVAAIELQLKGLNTYEEKTLWRWEKGRRCMTIETKWEEELVRAGQHGNHQAIDTLFRRYQRRLLGTARRIWET
jgi:hypothetical protein